MPVPGCLWVSSQITKSERLPEDRFASWYEDQHIDEVVALSGVPAAARYEAIPLDQLTGESPPATTPAVTPSPTANASIDGAAGAPIQQTPPWLLKAKWLTVYEMNDIEFRNTSEFKGLDGQTTPKGNLLQEVFSNARFETRFGRLTQHDERLSSTAAATKKGPAQLLISATLTPGSTQNAEEVEKWYFEEHVPLIAKCPGYVRTRRFKFVDTTVLHEFNRLSADPVGPGSVLALHEFEGPFFPMADLQKVDETPWTAKVLGGLKDGGMEAGFFRLKRVYGDFLRASSSKL